MRTRSPATVLTGALALSAVAVPAAHADGDTTITGVVVNGGAEVALGPTAPKTFKVSVTARDDSGIDAMNLHVRLPSYLYLASDRGLTCTAKSATTSTCTGSWTIDTNSFYGNGPADDPWYVTATVDAEDGDWITTERAGTFTVRRLAKLTVNASPEPARKDAKLTVTGKLTRADWKTHKNAGYSGRAVKLQFRKKESDTYSTVKTVTSGSGGALKTTVKATADGYWRWTFAGNSTTSTARATGDHVDVR
ncbi:MULTISPECIES: calcium-binding protein [Streptomyces]|uniref:calcium-binding protein n=1 Tax=Streptomyces TaxID=1883 RepID=UPI000BC4106F|nr:MULTISPECIES: calcium-binding protein [Streptomyces]MDX2553597.1 calcium-binding protein [Streptomyces stelliscabiei]MDX2613427.1 calcium-binding protein [Streptomyces stelliscabiei]MDX2640869.1 calcium-binding protein [Streptomyces stelliscabiei]MDX2664381.1 calcium-binding protein [Streptomyces stelliscabiei]MDX2713510.1 calcium-binding protein [Streptomyces stelliscabiei]